MILPRGQAAHTVYLLRRHDNHIIAPHIILGGYGSGAMVPRSPGLVETIPWSLSKGDWGLVQLMGLDNENLKSQKTRPQGTLYSIVKPLERLLSRAWS